MRGIRTVLSALLLALSALLLSVIAVAGTAAPPAAASGLVLAGVDDFRFASYDATFDLARTADGHSQLTTTETFVADFPAEQNRGMQRAVPLRYDGHPTEVRILSVTDESGAARPFETETDDGFLIVTSAADGYVDGLQTYTFTYTQKDVTLSGSQTESGEDEFYWDTNGTGWAQPFDRYSVRVQLDLAIAGAATGAAACYRGVEGSEQQCEVQTEQEALVASGAALAADENVTIAVGFADGTFTPRDGSYLASGWAYVQLFGFALTLAGLIAAIVLRATQLKDAPGRPTVVAEYTPPAIGLFSAAQLIGKTSKATAAAFVDFAVRGVVQIEERTTTGLLGREKEHYVLRLVDPEGSHRRRFVQARPLADDEREFLALTFGESMQPGAERDLSDKDTSFGKKIAAFITALPARAKSLGLRKKMSAAAATWSVIATFVGAMITIVSGALLLSGGFGGAGPLVLMIVAFVAIFAAFILVLKSPLTAQGAEARDHLRGLDLYIRLAEADRLRMLQSPGGADRRDARAAQVVELTEQLLPYAVLFGQEKEWAQALAVAYDQAGEGPNWYAGSHGFNAALFAGSVSSFSSSVTTSWSGSPTSSSSGGASGGGSSGGGGGGGGGGGV